MTEGSFFKDGNGIGLKVPRPFSLFLTGTGAGYLVDSSMLVNSGGSGGGAVPAPGSITKSMLSSEVLNDLNSSTPGPGTVTQQMLASELQAMLSGQSSSLFAPTLANPYGYAGGTPIESNASSFTVPSDKVLVILARAGHSILIPYSGMRFGDYSTRRNPFLVPPGTSFQLQDAAIGGWMNANGFAGILFDPVAHITPVLVSSGYQVPVGKVLVFGGSFDSAGSGEFSGISPTIHLAGSVVNGAGSGYLVDSSMLVNSGDRAVGLRLPGLRVCPPPFWHPRLPIPTASREAPRSIITAQSTLSPEIRYWSSCRLERTNQ